MYHVAIEEVRLVRLNEFAALTSDPAMQGS